MVRVSWLSVHNPSLYVRALALIHYLRKNDPLIWVTSGAVILVAVVISHLLLPSPPPIFFGAFGNSIEAGHWQLVVLRLAAPFLALGVFLFASRLSQQWAVFSRIGYTPLFSGALLFLWISPDHQQALPWICIAALAALIRQLMLIADEGESPRTAFFQAGTHVGLLALVHPVFVLCIFWILAAAVTGRSLQPKKLVIALIGLLLPAYFLLGVCSLLGYPAVAIAFNHLRQLSIDPIELNTITEAALPLFSLALAQLTSTGRWASATIRTKRKWWLLAAISWINITSLFLAKGQFSSLLAFMPSLFFLARFLDGSAIKWLANAVATVAFAFGLALILFKAAP